MKDLLVILHLHYENQLDYFLEKLSNIQGVSWDLVVTGASENAKDRLRAFKNDTVFLDVENIGYDIWPFIYCIRKVNLADYTVVFKLHTKNIRNGKRVRINSLSFKEAQWRDTLVDSLLASPKRFQEVMDMFKSNPKCGMVCSAKLYTSMKTPEDCGMLDRELSRIGLNTSERRFCAGSMFAIRASVLDKLKGMDVKREMFPSGGHTNDGGTIAHVYERILSLLAPSFGFDVKHTDNDLNLRIVIPLKKLCKTTFEWIFSLTRKGDCRIKYLTVFGLSLRLDDGYYHPDATLHMGGPAISVVVCTVNPVRLAALQENIKQTVGVPFEIIPIDNRDGSLSIFEAYNLGASKASGEVICFLHEDIRFRTAGWGWKLVLHFREEQKLGLVGSAGVHGAPRGKDCRDCPETSFNLIQQLYSATTGLSFKYHIRSNYKGKALNDVVAVDGLCLAIRGSLLSNGTIRFDDKNFSGFHQYDTDISFQVLDAGYRVCVCYDIIIEHLSEGSFCNAYCDALHILLDKWDAKLPFYAGRKNSEKMRKMYEYWENDGIWCTNDVMTPLALKQRHQTFILRLYNRAAPTIKDAFEEIDISHKQGLLSAKNRAKFKRKAVFYHLSGISSKQRKLNSPF